MTIPSSNIRVRIAPSPTGDPHVGTAYIALFNYVFAKKNNGKFILRIEDTDQTRSQSSSEEKILSGLKWLGLDWDEGPDKEGAFGPYRQSERLGTYKEHIDSLVEKGKAYPCFCSGERLAELRERQKSEGLQTKYDGHCRSLSPVQVQALKDEGKACVYRLRVPDEGVSSFKDELRGRIEINHSQLDDQILIKSDGYPTYHFANVVDDHLMKISHVVRAEEWISSTPKHVLLYQAFGWNEPAWIHMPLLRNQDKSKISKRKNPVSLDYYRRAGILPEAMNNFLGLMGWSYGDDKEIFSLEEMTEVFDFKKVSLGGPIFDQVKLNWLNQNYLHKLNNEQYIRYLREDLLSEEYLLKMKPLILERMSRSDEFVDKNSFFFNGSLDYQGLSILPKGREKKEFKKMISGLAEKLDELYDWQTSQIEECLGSYRKDIDWKPKDFFMPIRLIVTGRKDSPPLNETIEVLGREIVRFRLRDFLLSDAFKQL